MININQKSLANYFQKLHNEQKLLVIANVNNAGNALVFEKEGFKALTTSSAGIAFDLGYPDGQKINFADYCYIIKTILRRITLPLAVDFERGFSEDLDIIYQNAKTLLQLGVVGFDIEDGYANKFVDSPDVLCEKIKVLKKLKMDTGIDFVINARTCVFWLNIFSSLEKSIEYAINCCNLYLKAGADCVFIPGVMDYDSAWLLTQNINGPVNLILNSESNDLEILQKINVSRYSLGSGPSRLNYEQTINLAKNVQSNNCKQLIDMNFSYKDANEYFS